MTQPPPRPNLDAIAARVRNPGGTVGYWALKDIAVLLAYARSLETAIQEALTKSTLDGTRDPLLETLDPGRDGT